MNADELRALVADHFRSHAPAFGLDSDTLAVAYVLNPGGFVNFSFRIRDARRAYHLKLSATADDQTALRRWQRLADYLEPYHAPPILEWVEIGAMAGPLFPSLPGAPPRLARDVVDELVPVLRSLNADAALATTLQPNRVITARTDYMESLHDRFTEDLRGIRESPPPFVGMDLLRWMHGEVDALLQLVTSSAAFDEPMTTPIHGDLWLDNILWVSRRDWYLVDWDDLRIGDPASDLATLLGPTAHDLRPLKMLERVDGSLGPAQRERLACLGRATLLDWVIDPLADWVEAVAAPAHASAVRADKERIHRRALACYRELYR